MSLLEGILGNETIQRMAFGQLKGLFESKQLDFILVKLDAQGEVELELYKKGEAKIIPAHELLHGEDGKPRLAHFDSDKNGFPESGKPERIAISKPVKKKRR